MKQALSPFYSILFVVVLMVMFSSCQKEPITNNVFYVPNTFTSNGDGTNELFLPILSNNYTLTKYYLVVRNRNGEAIFESFDITKGWNGRYDNKLAESGVYLWEIRYTESNSSENQVIGGHITLLN